jgi:glycosyltransferase involved in cell wall biosynthesis
MSARPRISVVIPVFNRAPYLRACLDALAAQRDAPGPYQVVVVDNGSTDHSRSILADYPDVLVLEEPTPGAYAARNRGVRKALAPIVAFTDADCVASPVWVRAIDEGFRDPAVGIAIGEVWYPQSASIALRLLGAYENAKAEYVTRRDAPHRFAYGNNMAVRASVFDEVGLFSEWPRAADTELVHRLARRRPDMQVAFLPGMQVTHLEFLRARDRLRRLSLYTSTNSRIEGFRELSVVDRLRIAASLLTRRAGSSRR